jgi:hypothetical protein
MTTNRSPVSVLSNLKSSIMSNHSPSAESSVAQQSGAPTRTPENRPPRRVQWASEVYEDGVATGIRGHGPECDSDVISMHELDEAGLDVPMVYSFLSYLLIFLFTASRLPNACPCPRTSSLRLCITSPSGLCSIPTVPTVTIIYAILSRVVYASFSQNPRNRN